MNSSVTPARACVNCESAILPGQKYCPMCGQKSHTPRLTLHEIGAEFVHAMAHVDRSALSLIRQLLVKPGEVAREYVSGRRKRYYGPFAFLVVSVAFASAVIAISGFQVVTAEQTNKLADFLQHHVNLMFFIEVPLLAAFCRLIGIREEFNYAEYLVLVSYTSAMLILYYALIEVPVWYVLRSDRALLIRLFYISLPLGPLYFAFAMYQFLPGRRFSSALKGLLASILARGATQGVVALISPFFS
jgi:hypothetical protein